MMRIILAFLVVFGLFFFGIRAIREMTGMQRWTLTKYLGYSMMCATFTVVTLIVIVVLF